jgi:hypothetical protein
MHQPRYDTDAVGSPISYSGDALFLSIPAEQPPSESDDGTYLIPARSTDGGVGAYWSNNGTMISWFDLPPELTYACLALTPGQSKQVFASLAGQLAVVALDPLIPDTPDQVPVRWGFLHAQQLVNGNLTFPLYLPGQRTNHMMFLPTDASGTSTLFIYSSYLDPTPAGSNDAFTSFSSQLSPRCLQFYPMNVNCSGCNALTGLVTARNCAFCVASKLCTGFTLPDHAAAGAYCKDPGFPLSEAAACNPSAPSDGGSSKDVGVIVGSVLGSLAGVALCVLVFMWWRKRSSRAGADSGTDQNNYGSLGMK